MNPQAKEQVRIDDVKAAQMDVVPTDPGVPPVNRQNPWLLSIAALALGGLVVSGHTYRSIGTPPTMSIAHQASGDAELGEYFFQAYGCTACHVNHPLSASRGDVGPSLVNFSNQLMIAGVLPNNEANLIHYLQVPQDVVPGSAMLDLNVGEYEARHLAAYLYTLGVPPK